MKQSSLQEPARSNKARHARALDKARESGEPAGQIASRELEVERIRSAMLRAQELSGDAAEALEAATAG